MVEQVLVLVLEDVGMMEQVLVLVDVGNVDVEVEVDDEVMVGTQGSRMG